VRLVTPHLPPVAVLLLAALAVLLAYDLACLCLAELRGDGE
jgi:hypothetical protein